MQDNLIDEIWYLHDFDHRKIMRKSIRCLNPFNPMLDFYMYKFGDDPKDKAYSEDEVGPIVEPFLKVPFTFAKRHI